MHPRPNQAMQPTAGRRAASLNLMKHLHCKPRSLSPAVADLVLVRCDRAALRNEAATQMPLHPMPQIARAPSSRRSRLLVIAMSNLRRDHGLAVRRPRVSSKLLRVRPCSCGAAPGAQFSERSSGHGARKQSLCEARELAMEREPTPNHAMQLTPTVVRSTLQMAITLYLRSTHALGRRS
jgi:hypothetical protein